MSGPEAALRAEHVTKSYGGRTVIQDVSLRLEQGENPHRPETYENGN